VVAPVGSVDGCFRPTRVGLPNPPGLRGLRWTVRGRTACPQTPHCPCPSRALILRRTIDDVTSNSQQCTRFGVDGERCENTTAFADGWCSEVGCPGYVRPTPLPDEDHINGAPRGRANHIAATTDVALALDIDEVEDVCVSQRAKDSFRYHHRGSDAEAEVQLRAMLEDFLVRSARFTSRGGFVQLANSGYELILDPSLGTITGYRTVHQERTWEQVKAKVPSRYGKNRGKRHATGQAPEPGPALPPQEVLAQLDPAVVYLTGRARDSYAKVRKQQGLDDEALDVALRAELSADLLQARVGLGTSDRVVQLVADDLTWIVTCDASIAVGVRRIRHADLTNSVPPGSGSADSGGGSGHGVGM